MAYRCIICEGEDFFPLYEGKVINSYTINQCRFCGMVLAFPANTAREYNDFSNYGDYLILNEEEIQKRVKSASKTMKDVFRDIKRDYHDAKILDFGCGAGYFCKAAQEAGLNVFGVEPSDKLRLFCREKLRLKHIVRHISMLNCRFDAIFIFDVIEHLNSTISRDVMNELVSHFKPNALLIGQTPNFRSANILLFGDKDPVIWPPSHSCYFTMETIDEYLSSLGLKKVTLYSRGLSANSLFRKNKFEKSFLEKGIKNTKLYLVPPYIFIKVLVSLLGVALQPFNLGYQIYFTYKHEA